MSSDKVRRTEPTSSGGDRRWWAAVPLIVMVVAPLVVVFGEPLGIAGVLCVIAVGIVAESIAVRMAVRPSTS
jgi:hypothetical protein